MTEQNGAERSSETEELRRLLDEAGVEWVGTDYIEPTNGHATNTSLGHEHHDAVFAEYVDGTVLRLFDLTPEQAIAATLGSSNCTNSERTGTCHDKNGFDPEMGFECTVCGAMVDEYMVTPMDYGHQEQFRYCPGCGRRLIQL